MRFATVVSLPMIERGTPSGDRRAARPFPSPRRALFRVPVPARTGSGTCSAPSDAGQRQCDRSGDGRPGQRPASSVRPPSPARRAPRAPWCRSARAAAPPPRPGNLPPGLPAARSALPRYVCAPCRLVTVDTYPAAARTAWMPRSSSSSAMPSLGCRFRWGIARARKATPVISAPPAPYSRSAYVDHEDRAAAGRSETGLSLRWAHCPNAMKPGFHCVRAHWIRGFITFQLARRTRTVLLVVPA